MIVQEHLTKDGFVAKPFAPTQLLNEILRLAGEAPAEPMAAVA